MTGRTYVKQYEVWVDGLDNTQALLHPMLPRETEQNFYAYSVAGAPGTGRVFGILFSKSGYVSDIVTTGENDRSVCIIALVPLRYVVHAPGIRVSRVNKKLQTAEYLAVGTQLLLQWSHTVTLQWGEWERRALAVPGTVGMITIRLEPCALLNAAAPGMAPDMIHSPPGSPPPEFNVGGELRALLSELHWSAYKRGACLQHGGTGGTTAP